jgi:proteasome lid subunit RPN8/RPN11
MVFSQLALKRTREHATSSANAPVGGILIGRVHEDPTWGRRWVLVEDAVPAARPLPEDPSAEALETALGELIESEAPDRVVGWYRTHARRGVYLSEEEARLHQHRFGQPWQCTLILVGNEQHPVGGVFQPTEDQGLSRSVYTPFFELVDASSDFSTAWKRTFVGWSNYQTEVSVALAGKAGVSAELPSAPDRKPNPVEEPAPEPVVEAVPEPVVEAAPEPVVEAAPEPVVEAVPDAPAEPYSGPTPGPIEPMVPNLATELPPVGPETRPEVVAPASTEPDLPDAESEAEEEWSEIQIRRSLSAVGRTLGPAGLSSPGPSRARQMEPVELKERESEAKPASDLETPSSGPDPVSESRPPAQSSSPAQPRPPVESSPPLEPVLPAADPEALSHVHDANDREDPTKPVAGPGPIRSDVTSPESVPSEPVRPLPSLPEPPGADMRSTLVGGSRRRSHMPVRTIAVAAAGLVAVLGGGWIIQDRLGGGGGGSTDDGSAQPVTVSQAPDGEESATSVAGLTLGEGPLFPRGSDDSPGEDADLSQDGEVILGPEYPEARSNGEVLAEDPVDGSSAASTPEDGVTGEPPTEQPGRSTLPDQRESGEGAGEAGRTDPNTAREAAARLDTTIDLSLSEISLDVPEVAAFEDAFAIFRMEVSRYDDLRVAFDDQLEGCNALNLSYRLVGESFKRLSSRFERAREHFAGPGLQAFQNAQRQAAVIDRHYELSECPPPIGG